MSQINLNLTPLNNAIASLEEGIVRYQLDTGDSQIRDGLIQRFEFTYELSYKMLKRYLEMTSATPDQYNNIAFQDLIRTGNEQDLLLSDWSQWKKYRDLHSRTSHTYDETIAVEVAGHIPEFLGEAVHLRNRLQSRLV